MEKHRSKRVEKMPPVGALSSMELDTLPVPDRPRKLGDGGGLYLDLQPSGARYWRLRYERNGKDNTLSLGVFPTVSLDEARRGAQAVREQLAAGVDPCTARKEARAQARDRVAADFLVSSSGSLVVDLAGRRFTLNPDETARLRAFLIATASLGVSEHGY
jgi:hypothetical protein